MPVNSSQINPVSSITAGGGLASTLNVVIERSNESASIINANERHIGDVSTLKSDDKSSLTNAFNELVSRLEDGDLISVYVGLLKDLNTQNKTNIVAAVNEVNNSVGPLTLLEIEGTTNVVSALNYLNNIVGTLADLGDGDFTSITDALNAKVSRTGDDMSGPLEFKNALVSSTIHSGDDGVSTNLKNSFEIRTPGGVGFYTNGTGTLPEGQASHYFNTTNGDATIRGVATIEKDLVARKNILISGTKASFRSTLGAELGSLSGDTLGNLTLRTGSDAGPAFLLEGNQFRLPAAPSQANSATTKSYVDDGLNSVTTNTDSVFYKKTGGTISGTVTATGKINSLDTVEAVHAMNIKRKDSISSPTLLFKSVDGLTTLASVYYDINTNTAKISTGATNFEFLADGNLKVQVGTVPSDALHLTPKNYVDGRIEFARARADHTGFQPMSTISDAGLLATKNKITVSDVDATGTANASSALFGDGSWKAVDLDLSKFVRNNLTSLQSILGPLTVINTGGIKARDNSTDPELAIMDETGTKKTGIKWNRASGNTEFSYGSSTLTLAANGDMSLPGGQQLKNDGTSSLGAVSGSTGAFSGAVSSGGILSGVGAANLKASGSGADVTFRFQDHLAVERAKIVCVNSKNINFHVNGKLWEFMNDGTTAFPGTILSSNGVFKKGSADTAAINIGSNQVTVIQSPTSRVNFATNGDVKGSADTGSTWLWTIDGTTGAFTTSGDLTALSDAREKTNIKAIRGAVEKVKNLSGVTFEKLNEPGVTKYGFIAQEVLEVVPELVREKDDRLTVDATHGFESILVEAVKELIHRVEVLEEENRRLKS